MCHVLEYWHIMCVKCRYYAHIDGVREIGQMVC